MPNQPSPATIATSFTLPRGLLDLVEREARRKLTNKSDIIRQALMNYLTPGERALVQEQQMAGLKQTQQLPPTKKVIYEARRKKKGTP